MGPFWWIATVVTFQVPEHSMIEQQSASFEINVVPHEIGSAAYSNEK